MLSSQGEQNKDEEEYKLKWRTKFPDLEKKEKKNLPSFRKWILVRHLDFITYTAKQSSPFSNTAQTGKGETQSLHKHFTNVAAACVQTPKQAKRQKGVRITARESKLHL